MAEKTMGSLSLELDLKTAQLNKKTDEVNRRLKRMESQNKSFAKNLKSNFLLVTGAVAGLSGALKVTKDIMASTQTTGDKLTHTTAGLKQGLESVYENIATFDIKSIASDWENAYHAAYIYSQVLDDIGDQSLAISIRRAEGLTEIAEMRWQREKAIAEERYDDALELQAKLKTLDLELLERERSILDQRLKAWNDNIARKEDLTNREVDGLIDLIRNYDLYAKEIEKVQKIKDLEAWADGKKVWTGIHTGWVGPSKKQKQEAEQEAKEQLAHLNDVEMGIYAVWDAYDKLSDEQRQEFAEILTKSAQLQRENLTMLVEMETKEKSILNLKKAQLKAEQDENSELNKSNYKIPSSFDALMQGEHNDVGGITPGLMPDIGPVVNPAMEQLDTFNDKLLTTADIVNSLSDAFLDMFGLIGESLIEGQSDWTDYAQVAIKMLQQVIGYMLGAALAKIVEKGAEGGPIGAAIALAAGLGILGIASAAISSYGDQKYALGGVVQGNAMYGDQINARLNPGELVINPSDQNRLWNMLRYGGYSSSGNWETANVDIGFDKLRIGLVRNAQIMQEK